MSLFSKGESFLRNTIRKDRTERDLSEGPRDRGEQRHLSAIYWSHPREPYQFITFIRRSAIDPAMLSAAVTKEIHALGAKHGDILRLIAGHGMKLTLTGIAIGVIASLALTRVMAKLLFVVTATDLPTFVAVSAVLTTIALVANYIPARRATRLSAVIALRYE